MTTKQGIFCISLDTELFWGVHDSHTEECYSNSVLGAKAVIPQILSVFREYSIHATWAIVGFLFAKTKTEIYRDMPVENDLPKYKTEERSSYRLLAALGESEDEAPLFFYPSLIDTIRSAANQEIASHTFSHYYCAEEGQGIAEFEADLDAMQRAAEQHDVTLSSIVFPRNQAFPNYVSVCLKKGYLAYRGLEENWIHKVNPTILLRILRLLDAYLPLSINTYDLLDIRREAVCNIRGSRFFRPYSARLYFLEPLKLMRIKKEMTYSAKNGKIYHLWWHPHNFGSNPEIAIKQLRIILDHFRDLNERYGFISLTMHEITDLK